MTGSLLGYFFYLGTAFAALITFLINVLGDSTALSKVSRHPSHAIMRHAAANELNARALKKQEHLQALGASEKEETKVPSGNPDQPLVITTAKADIEKNESERLVHQRKLKVAARRRDNVPRAYATALSYADESPFAKGRYGPFTNLDSH
jgi:hypothetical protein